MQLISIIQVTCLVANAANAVPIGEPEAFNLSGPLMLARRANPTAVECGTGAGQPQQLWSLDVIQNAFTALQTNEVLPRHERAKAGERYYPQQLGQGSEPPRDQSVQIALDAIPECATSLAGTWKWFEFPITDPTFTTGEAGSQGPDRVVAIAKNVPQGGTRSFTYCLAMTHRDEINPGDFDPCAVVANVHSVAPEQPEALA